MKKNKWAGTKPAWGRYGGHFQPAHPLREAGDLIDRLSETGIRKALNLKFGPERKRGSEESLRARPREPGQGLASRLSKPALRARIADLYRYVDVQQFAVLR